MEEKLEYFELNNKVLEDFDNLMKKHLDQVKHLKIDKNIKNDKLYNIISLCFNIDTLDIDSDMKLDINRIFASVCKPTLLHNIMLKNVKLPTGKILGKFKNIKTVQLEKIKFSNINKFFEEIDSNSTIEELKFQDVDFMNNTLEFINNFTNLKRFQAKNLIKAKLENMDFLENCKMIEDVTLKGNKVQFKEISHLIKCKYKKNIVLQLESKSMFRNYLNVQNNEIKIKINAIDLEELTKNISFFKIKSLEIIFDEQTNFEEFIKILKKVKDEVTICITDISKLTVEQSLILKDRLNIKTISIVNTDQEILSSYDIETFIKMRQTIEKFIEEMPNDLQEEKKFLWIYKSLLQNIQYDETEEIREEDALKKGLIEQRCISKGYSEILKNCLMCLNFEVNMVSGILKKENKQWYWIQVLINGKWYNADIALDSKKNKKMKYCLISNEKISKFHEINSKSMYCIDNFDEKIIAKFWKNNKITGREKRNLLKEIINKLKILLMTNKRLPEGKPNNEEVNNDNTK